MLASFSIGSASTSTDTSTTSTTGTTSTTTSTDSTSSTGTSDSSTNTSRVSRDYTALEGLTRNFCVTDQGCLLRRGTYRKRVGGWFFI